MPIGMTRMTPSIPMSNPTPESPAEKCERCGKPVDSPNFAYHVCVAKNEATMSPEEQIRYLAERVMGWKKTSLAVIMPAVYGDADEDLEMWEKNPSSHIAVQNWHPDHDWNHWRQVEEKVMEDELLVERYLYCFEAPWRIKAFLKADLPTRVSALIQAHKELYGE